jgi:hypothetical protein
VQNFCTSCVHIKLLVWLYNLQYVETLVDDCVVSVTATTKTDKKCKLMLMEEKLDVKNLVVAT